MHLTAWVGTVAEIRLRNNEELPMRSIKPLLIPKSGLAVRYIGLADIADRTRGDVGLTETPNASHRPTGGTGDLWNSRSREGDGGRPVRPHDRAHGDRKPRVLQPAGGGLCVSRPDPLHAQRGEELLRHDVRQ